MPEPVREGASARTGEKSAVPVTGDEPSLVRLGPAARALGIEPREVEDRARERGVSLHRVERGGEVTLAIELSDLPRLVDTAPDPGWDVARELVVERDEARAERRAAEQTAAEAERRAEELEAELRVVRARQQERRDEVRAVRAESTALARDLDEERRSARASEERVEDLERQAGALESAWDEERRARVELAGRVERGEQRIVRLEAEVREGLDREAEFRERADAIAAELEAAREREHRLEVEQPRLADGD